MPTTTEQKIRGYAHCRAPRCPGNQQEEVDVLKIEDAYTYAEKGGDLPGVETSHVRLVFLNDGIDDRPDDVSCPHCGRNRDLSEDPRPNYDPLSGYAQDGLLDIPVSANGTRFDPSKQAEIQAEVNEKRDAENAELRERLAKLEGYLMGQAQPETPETEA